MSWPANRLVLTSPIPKPPQQLFATASRSHAGSNKLIFRSRRERRQDEPAVQSCSLLLQGSLFRSHGHFASATASLSTPRGSCNDLIVARSTCSSLAAAPAYSRPPAAAAAAASTGDLVDVCLVLPTVRHLANQMSISGEKQRGTTKHAIPNAAAPTPEGPRC